MEKVTYKLLSFSRDKSQEASDVCVEEFQIMISENYIFFCRKLVSISEILSCNINLPC